MEFEKSGSLLNVRLIGEVNSDNAPDIIKAIFSESDGVTGIVFDLKDLEYISTAGLRMLLCVKKVMNNNMTVKNVNDEVMEIFRIAGFTSLMKIKQ